MNEIDATAADWAARFDGASPAPETVAALEAWLALDTRHVGAFARAQAILIAYEDARVGQDAGAPPAAAMRAGETDRRRMLWGGGIAAGLTALGVGGVWFASADTAYATERGERRVLDLADSAELTMNTLTRVEVRERGGLCRVRFLDGEILVQSRTAAMTILSDRIAVTPDDAQFGLRRMAAGSVLTVISGAVTIETPTEPQAATISKGRRVLLSGAGVSPLPALDDAGLERALAWRAGRIAFQGETLREAVAEFERYGPTPIVVVDGAAAARRISGLFSAADPSGFARSVAVTSDLRAEARDGRIYLSAPPS